MANENEFVHGERFNQRGQYRFSLAILEFESGVRPTNALHVNFLRVFCEFFD